MTPTTTIGDMIATIEQRIAVLTIEQQDFKINAEQRLAAYAAAIGELQSLLVQTTLSLEESHALHLT